jgi:hypothetical protein
LLAVFLTVGQALVIVGDKAKIEESLKPYQPRP